MLLKKIAQNQPFILSVVILIYMDICQADWQDMIYKLYGNFKDENGWEITQDYNKLKTTQQCDFNQQLINILGGIDNFGFQTSIKQDFLINSNQIKITFKFFYTDNTPPINNVNLNTYLIVKVQQIQLPITVVKLTNNTNIAKCTYNNASNTDIYQVTVQPNINQINPSLKIDVQITTNQLQTEIYDDISWGISEFVISYFQCHYSCSLCQSLLDTDTACTSCPLASSKRQFNNGNNSCPCISPYFDNGQTQCAQCHSSCKTCQGLLSTDCTSCPTQFYLYRDDQSSSNNSCPCKYGFFEVELPECQRCNYSCANCTIKATNCLSCPQDSNRLYQMGECPCQTSFFDKGERVCQPCHYSCESCSQTAENCTTCSTYQNREDFIAVNNTCPCSIGYYQEQQNELLKSICQSCHSSCYRCDGPLSTQCLECPSVTENFRQSVPIDGVYWQCPCLSGYYSNGIKKCNQCHYSCKECQIFTKTCTSCPEYDQANVATNREFNQTKNTCNCIEGYFDAGKVSCLKCHKMCKTCEKTERYCLTCKNNQYRYDPMNLCICKKGFYTIWDDYTCLPCTNHCISCDKRSDLCLSCDLENEFREIYIQQCVCSKSLMRIEFNGTCICKEGYFQTVYNTCSACHPLCKTCSLNATNCTSCLEGNYWIKNNLNTCTCQAGLYLTENRECREATLSTNVDIAETNGVFNPELKIKFNRPLKYDETVIFNSFKVIVDGMMQEVDYNVLFIAYDQQQYGVRLYFNESFIKKRLLTLQITSYDRIVDKNGVPLSKQYQLEGIQGKIGPFIMMNQTSWQFQNMKNLAKIQKNFFQKDNLFNRIRSWLRHIQFLSYKFTFLQVSLLLMVINTVLPCNFFLVIEMFSAFIWGHTPCWQSQNPDHGYSYFSLKVGQSQNKFFVSQALYDMEFSQDYLSNNSIGFFLILFFTSISHFYKYMQEVTKKKSDTYLQSRYELLHLKANSLLIWTFESGFLVNWVSIFLNISNYNSGSVFSVFSCMVAYCMMFYEIHYFYQAYKVINAVEDKPNEYPNNLYQVLTTSVKVQDDRQTPFIILNFNLLCQAKKFVVAFLLVYIQDSLAQVICLWLLHLVFLILRIKIFPFKTHFDNWSRIALEGMLVAIYSTLFLYQLHIKPIAVLQENQVMSPSLSLAMLHYGEALIAFFVIFAFLCLVQDLLWIYLQMKQKIRKYLRMNYYQIKKLDEDQQIEEFMNYNSQTNEEDSQQNDQSHSSKQIDLSEFDEKKNQNLAKQATHQIEMTNIKPSEEIKPQDIAKQRKEDYNLFWENSIREDKQQEDKE